MAEAHSGNPSSCDSSAAGDSCAIRRRAEVRRRKLLLQSEDRMKRILGVKCGNSQARKLCPEEAFEEPSVVDTGRNSLGSCSGSESQFGMQPPFSQLRFSPDKTAEQSEGQPSPQPGEQSSEEHDARDLGQCVVRPGVMKPLRLLLSIVVAVMVRLFFTSYTSLFVPFLNLEMVLFAVRILRNENVRGHDSEKSMEVHQNAQDVEDSTRQKAWNKHVVPSCLEKKYNDKSCQKVFCHPWERCLQDRCMCLIPNECPRVGGPVCSLGGNRLPSYCKLKSLECLRQNSKYAFSNFMSCSKPRFSIKEERGWLFLQISGDWLPVCAKMNMPTANAACRQLGLSLGAKTVQNKMMVSKTNTNSSNSVTKLLCKGWESSLAECQYKLGKYNKCQRLGHIHINCYKEERGCNISEFECANKKCVPRTRMCNGDDDCADRSDELCCQSCSKGALLCSTGNCVALSSLCDGEADCINHEDEANCTSTKKSGKYDNEVIVQERQKIGEAALPVCGNSSFGTPSIVSLQPRSSRNRRLIGGTQATQDQFPWQAALLQDREWTCGAVFIGGNWFLTAAHCVTKAMAEYKVRVGELARLTRESTQDELLIDRIVKHPRYNSRTNKNDVALLFVAKMDHIHLYTPSLTPACIPQSSLQFPPGAQCFASGWGRALELTTLAKRPDVLRWVKLNLIGNCSAFHGERFTEGMECAGSLDGSADTCDGDSGGPLICYNSLNDAYVWGIVSWGHKCGTEGFPGVYAKVAFYYTWIRSITGKDIFKH